MSDAVIYVLALLSGAQTGILLSMSRSLGKMEALLPLYDRRITVLERK